ncbi:MAG: NERD domain-containing protein [Spirochaetaceae bacterium]|nr:NERD domain-containing protein [Spirochaetaceae bacterium]
MAKGLIDLLLDQIFDAEWTGKHGEKLTERELKLVQLFGRKGKILRNVYLPKENGETSEVDVIYITQKGIFVFESKNYSGWIFGDEKEQYWTAMLPNKEKNKFYNPIKQNRTHLKWMKEYVGDDIPLFSIIVFSERCELKKVAIQNKDIRVIKRDRTYATVRDIWDKNPDAVEVEKIDKLYERLKKLTNVDESVKVSHVANIEKKYKKPEKIVDSNPIVEIDTETKSEQRGEAQAMQTTDLFCPKCGGRMILRIARKGANAGNQFYGCENFPKCRFVKNI